MYRRKTMSTKKSAYHYDLPDNLIAKKPADPRDASRMLALNRDEKTFRHGKFSLLPTFLQQGSILVVNDSRVIPARLPGKRATGASIELLLVHEEQAGLWRCKVKNSARIKPGEILDLCEGALSATLVRKMENGDCQIRFPDPETLFQSLEQFGYAPLPPYIHRVRTVETDRTNDLINYQTIFASEYGAIAAPTAGLHFTPGIVEELGNRNIEIVTITLHVGLGTFEPLRVEDVRRHKMHEEEFFVSEETATKINQAKKRGRKIVAVGTTATRTLESAWKDGCLQAGPQKTDLFIYPPYRFHVVDQLLTNFHLPESTLLMLVSAFADREFVLDAYREAVQEEYRFYSYGDCMLIR